MSAVENASTGNERLAEAEARTNGAATDDRGVEELTAENARLREEVACLRAGRRDLAQLEAAVKRLEHELAEVVAERDLCVKSLNYLTRKDFTFTAEEIADMEKNGVALDEQFIEELERELRS